MRWLTEFLFIYLIPLAIMIFSAEARAGLLLTAVIPVSFMLGAWLFFRKPWRS